MKTFRESESSPPPLSLPYICVTTKCGKCLRNSTIYSLTPHKTVIFIKQMKEYKHLCCYA